VSDPSTWCQTGKCLVDECWAVERQRPDGVWVVVDTGLTQEEVTKWIAEGYYSPRDWLDSDPEREGALRVRRYTPEGA